MPPEGEPSTTTLEVTPEPEEHPESPRLIQARRIYVLEGKYPKKLMQTELAEAGVELPQPKYKKKELDRIFFKTFGVHFMKVAEERRRLRIERQKTTNTNKFDYIIVIDFECTCTPSDAKKVDFDAFEIIEFPAVVIDVNQCCIIEDYFHRYIRPVRNQVTEFCTKLTGITATEIAYKGISLQRALLELRSWLKEKGIIDTDKQYAYAVDGQSDIGHFLQTSLKLNGLPFLHDFRRYIDVKTAFQHSGYSKNTIRLKRMLKIMDMKFDGRMHCGLDDTRNIAKVMLRLLQEGHSIDYTHKLVPQDMLAQYPENACVNSTKLPYNKWMDSSTLRPITLSKTAISKGKADTCDICGEYVCRQKYNTALA